MQCGCGGVGIDGGKSTLITSVSSEHTYNARDEEETKEEKKIETKYE